MSNTGPTEAQRAARRELAEARGRTLERKKRTRRLIEIGGTLDSYGVSTPEQAEELMRAVLRGGKGWRRFLERIGARETGKWPGAAGGPR